MKLRIKKKICNRPIKVKVYDRELRNAFSNIDNMYAFMNVINCKVVGMKQSIYLRYGYIPGIRRKRIEETPKH